jgi:hypothetical protein
MRVLAQVSGLRSVFEKTILGRAFILAPAASVASWVRGAIAS